MSRAAWREQEAQSKLKSIPYENRKFVFHRLAINGLDSGSMQPIQENDVTLICNGEIFNYKELYRALEIKPNTKSDCEIILHLYIRFGIERT